MDKKIAIIAVIAVVVIFAAVFAAGPWSIMPQQIQEELDFTVSGSNDCLRFLTPTVQTAYVPFRTGANEQWQVSIECTQMPGAQGWTEVYLYKGYWEQGTNYMCLSKDLYPIIDKIETTDFQIKTNSTFTETFGDSTPQSYTLFFLMPPGGTGTYHVTLKQIK
jgi:hypothetical protein